MEAMVIVIAILVVNTLLVSWAAIPDGYIVDIKPQCGSDGVVDAAIVILSDLPIHIHAVCAEGNLVTFTLVKSATYVLFISYPVEGGGNSSCVFESGPGTLAYSVEVTLWYGESVVQSSMLHQYEEEYTVTCTYSSRGNNQSADKSILPGLTRLRQIQSHRGPPSGSYIELSLTDVLNNELPLEEVHLGRTVTLTAFSNNTDDVGIRPLFCDALNSRGEKYAVLRFGCGDGLVFDKYAGFLTNGRRAESPYFRAFSINADKSLTFECNFTICDTNCDGNSCTIPFPNRRRDADQNPKMTPSNPQFSWFISKLGITRQYHLIKTAFTADSSPMKASPGLGRTL